MCIYTLKKIKSARCMVQCDKYCLSFSSFSIYFYIYFLLIDSRRRETRKAFFKTPNQQEQLGGYREQFIFSKHFVLNSSWFCNLRVVSFELRVVIYNFKKTNLRVASLFARVSNLFCVLEIKLRVASCNLRAASCFLRVANLRK